MIMTIDAFQWDKILSISGICMIFIIFGGLKLLSISILLSVKKPGEKY
jgi:hypothetical protein